MEFNADTFNRTVKLFSDFMQKEGPMLGVFLLKTDIETLKPAIFKKITLSLFYHYKSSNLKCLEIEKVERVANGDFTEVIDKLNAELQYELYKFVQKDKHLTVSSDGTK